VRLRRAVGLVSLAVVASGCRLPRFGAREPITEQGGHTLSLWQGFFLVACVVAAIVFGLILFVTVRFRRRDDRVPSQVGDNFRIEAVYMITPVVIVACLFAATVVTQSRIDPKRRPDLTVDVTGFQWGWRFHYPAQHVTISGSGVEAPPVLVLPEGRTTRLVLRTTDVIHSFWVPSFLSKRDLIQGVRNSVDVTPTATGTYDGRCAEYCGLDHWRMSFVLRVVPANRFDAALAEARRGST
jgi:cytochrome c oxidase subunit 2